MGIMYGMLTLIKEFINSVIKEKLIFSFLLFFLLPIPTLAKLDVIMEIEGNYLAYSYDYNYLYGEGNLNIRFYQLKVSGERVKIDFNSNTLTIFGSVKLESIDSSSSDSIEEYSGDQFTLDLKAKKGELVSYQKEIEKSYLDSGLNEAESFSLPTGSLKEVNLNKIQGSFLYYTFHRMELMENFKIVAYGVLCHVEGLESVYLKKFSLKKGTINLKPGARINRIWYTSTQGIIGEAEMHLLQSDKTYSRTHFNYEERSVLKEHLPPDRIFRFYSENKVIFSRNSSIGLNANYDSFSNWTASLYLNQQIKNLGSMNIDFSHIHPIGGFRPETWVRASTSFSFPKVGNFGSSLGYEAKGQLLSAVSFSKDFLKRFRFGLNASYNTAKESEVLSRTKIFSGNASLSYRHGYFNILSNFSLNSDLISHSSLGIPQISLNLSGISFYNNLLHFGITNNFYYYLSSSQVTGKTRDYSDNLIFEISSNLTTLPFIDNLNLSLRAEELFRQGREGYLSTGFLVNLRKGILKDNVYLNVVYAYNTHRKNRNWFIEGTYYQNLLTYLDFSFLKRMEANVSLNIDPNSGRFINSFSTLSYQLGRAWYIHSSLQYDFLMKKINNLDFYLIRDAKKFDIRLVWRYLTKQIFIEIVPK
jgi:hypothetical protein